MNDNTNTEQIEDKTDLEIGSESRYQIVQSFLPNKGDYQIDNRTYLKKSFLKYYQIL